MRSLQVKVTSIKEKGIIMNEVTAVSQNLSTFYFLLSTTNSTGVSTC